VRQSGRARSGQVARAAKLALGARAAARALLPDRLDPLQGLRAAAVRKVAGKRFAAGVTLPRRRPPVASTRAPGLSVVREGSLFATLAALRRRRRRLVIGADAFHAQENDLEEQINLTCAPGTDPAPGHYRTRRAPHADRPHPLGRRRLPPKTRVPSLTAATAKRSLCASASAPKPALRRSCAPRSAPAAVPSDACTPIGSLCGILGSLAGTVSSSSARSNGIRTPSSSGRPRRSSPIWAAIGSGLARNDCPGH
jgi:hypothetical protein